MELNSLFSQDLDVLAEVYEWLSEMYLSTMKKMKEQAECWRDMATLVEASKARLASVGRLLRNKHRRGETEALGKKLEDLQNSYGSLEAKISAYLKELDDDGLLALCADPLA